jgi:hypothetical protein
MSDVFVNGETLDDNTLGLGGQTGVNNISFSDTLTADGATGLPCFPNQLEKGKKYLPTNLDDGFGPENDPFSLLITGLTGIPPWINCEYGDSLDVFINSDPNGAWCLYVVDDNVSTGNVKTPSKIDGWRLDLTYCHEPSGPLYSLNYQKFDEVCNVLSPVYKKKYVKNSQVLQGGFLLTPAQEVNEVRSDAQGVGIVTLDTEKNLFTWNIFYSGLTGTEQMAHFHGPASVGQNANAIITLSTGSPKIGSQVITDGQVADIIAGLWYVNIHTDVYPGGEIRGQVILEEPNRGSSDLALVVDCHRNTYIAATARWECLLQNDELF